MQVSMTDEVDSTPQKCILLELGYLVNSIVLLMLLISFIGMAYVIIFTTPILWAKSYVSCL
jgi:hypothetical protein